jgi:hypothetical protein
MVSFTCWLIFVDYYGELQLKGIDQKTEMFAWTVSVMPSLWSFGMQYLAEWYVDRRLAVSWRQATGSSKMLANYTLSYPRTLYLAVSFICISICVAVFGMPNRRVMVNTSCNLQITENMSWVKEMCCKIMHCDMTKLTLQSMLPYCTNCPFYKLCVVTRMNR